ncbi:transposase [uncultured Ilyobacter sp.]|uniref:transposase n=1 Tax=uncultured Ilyobacter sp. TaxID=544433 RepID=UPI002AA6AD4F|nr:transposase [uncultured Ilyobacter sp.]
MNILTLNSDFFKYFFKLDCKWSLPQRKHLFNFVDGIINSGGKKTLSNIWRNSLNTRDRSSFNKFLLYSPWDEKNLNYARKKTALNEMSMAGSKNPFFFSIDDTLSSKKTSSKNIEGLKFNYSHVSNKNEWSHCIVSLHGHSNGLSLPLDFKTYLSEESGAEQKRSFKTKIDLALDTLEGIDIQLERKSYVLTDSWYTSAGFINKTQQLGFQVISGIKSNRIFYPDGIRAKLSEYSLLPLR